MTNNARYADVAPAVPMNPAGRQTYTYRLPETPSVKRLDCVTIPLGPRQIVGVVLRLHKIPPPRPAKMCRPLDNVAITPRQLEFAQWLARTMHGSLGYTLRLFIPPGRKMPLAGRKSRKKQMLVLVPEKHLAEFHAGLPTRRQAEYWAGVRDGSISKIVGTQKSLFLPFKNLAKITIEHAEWPTHKLWDQYPRLDNRDGARRLAEIYSCELVEKSSLRSPKANLFELSFAAQRRGHIIPSECIPILRSWLKRGEHILFLYNRRGKSRQNIAKALAGLFSQHKSRFTLATQKILTDPDKITADRIVWLFPETALTFPDYRTHENAVILLSRLHQIQPSRLPAGRQGHSVMLITRRARLVQHWLTRPLAAIQRNIASERRRLNLPPFSDLIRLTVTAKTPAAAVQQGIKLRETLQSRAAKQKSTNVFGPYPDGPKSTTQYLLLAGDAKHLPDLYADVAFASADLSPHQVTGPPGESGAAAT